MSNPTPAKPVLNQGETCFDGASTGMAWSILTEISRRLEELTDSGKQSSISLRNMPMTEADRAQLDELLGKGEVEASLELAGPSKIWETLYQGVWWIEHRGADGKVACEEIAITPIPEILMTHPVDIRAAAGRLKNKLEQIINRIPDNP